MDNTSINLAELLRHPDDLDKISSMKLEYTRKKQVVDSQLKSGLKEQLEITQSGMNGITDGQRTVQLIKEEMMKIDKLCAEAQNMILDFPNINLVSQTQRNFSAVEKMRTNLREFPARVAALEEMLRENDETWPRVTQLLPAHYELTQLRNIQEDALEQIERSDEPSFKDTLEAFFGDLDGSIAQFDEQIGLLCSNLTGLIQQDMEEVIVRLAIVIEAEERSDKRVKALQEALKDHKEMAVRFQSITDGAKSVRGYKDNFLKCIENKAALEFATTRAKFEEDSSRLDKLFKWFFNDLNMVKIGMVNLFPKKWRIFQTYAKIYHKGMHDFLIGLVDDPETSPSHILTILKWPELYYKKMAKLELLEEDLMPHVLDNREATLVAEFRGLIVKFLDEWIDTIGQTERKDFANRTVDDNSNLTADEYGFFRTKNLVDMWRMLAGQIDAAGTSGRFDVTEGVVDVMFIRLRNRQASWQKMLDDEVPKFTGKDPETDQYMAQLQDWIVAIANDQIACVDDNEAEGRFGYLTTFRQKLIEPEPLVSQTYINETLIKETDILRDSYTDLSLYCLSKFSQLVFNVDFKDAMADFFTPKWYTSTAMSQICVTFEEYIGDYKNVLHVQLLQSFINALSTELLTRYLLSVRNKGAKFKRQDPFTKKMEDDITAFFTFLDNNPNLEPGMNDEIKTNWRVMQRFDELIATDKAGVPNIFAEFKTEYWDLQLTWVEAVLRARDDYDRSLMNAVKARAAQLDVTRGQETLMGKIK